MIDIFKKRAAPSLLIVISTFILMSGKVHADLSNLIDFENDGPFPGGTTSYSDDLQFDDTDVFTLSNGTTVNFKFIKDIDGVEGTTAAEAATNPGWYIEDTANKKVASSSGTTFSNDANFAYLSTGATAKPAGSNYAADGVAAGYESQAGDFFLRGQNGFGWTDFVVTYGGTAISSASGEIWDLDQGVDGVRVTAYDSLYNELAYNLYDISEGDAALDSAPWQWAFSNVGTISYIYISKLEAFGSVVAGQYANFDGDSSTGTDTSGINFRMAFNNFNATSAAFFGTPEPSSLLAFGGILSIAILRRRRRSETVYPA